MSSPSGTNYQSVTIAGAWRQKDVGSAKRCVRWTRGIFSLGDIPAAAYSIVGSNDQTTWYLLDRVSNQNTTSINRTVNANYSQYSYRYYRWIEESKVSGSIYILNHWFGMFDENNAQLTTNGSFTASNGAGDVGGNSSTSFVIDSANGTSGTFNWQQTSNYASGPYTGPTSTLVYDPTQPVAPQPISVNVLGSWIQMDFGSGKTMTSYGMFTDNPPYAPVSWKMTGSNDGTTWYEIDRKSGLNWTQNATQNFSPSGFFAGTSYRYYRFIIQSIATGASVITPTRFYASDANGYIGWVGDGISTISSDLTNQRSPNNWNMNTTGGPTNFFGTSSYPSGTYNGSVSTAVFVPPFAPTAPTSLVASTGNGSATISFTQGSDGGASITNYKYSLNGGSTFTALSPADTTSPVVITGLTNGVSYTIQLKGVNSIGDGDASASITVSLPTPRPLYGNYCNFTLSSASAIASYGLGVYDPAMTIYKWALLGSNDNTTWELIDRKTQVNNTLYNTTAYTLSSTSPTYTYARLVFEAYNNTNAPNGFFYMGGFWLKRADGSFITSSSGTFSSEFYANGTPALSLATNTVTGAVGPNIYIGNGSVQYTALLGVYNGPGFSYTGTVSSPTLLPPSAPPAPTSLSASAGNESVSISFTQGSDGGSAITNYKYSLNGGSTFTAFSPADTTSPVVITGLTNGVAYTIQLKAVNSLGDGDASASITVTPATNPNAPTNLVASYAGSGAVQISFTPGSNGGETITNYQYSLDCGATFTPLSPVDGITPVTITGLTNGQSYCIELKAVNVIGAGAASSSVQYTPYGPVDAPTNLTWVDTLNGTISLSFTPGSVQGSAITNYEYSLDGGNTFTAFNPAQTTSPVSISGLNIRTHYSLVLRGVNAAPEGVSSATLNMYYMCFLEGTKILCFNPETNQEEYRAIETLRKGSLVKTVDDGYKAIDMIGTSKIYNPGNSVRSKNRLYKCSKENYPDLKEDLVITGCHSILVKDISEEERAELMDYQGKIYITDNHYRLIAAVDKRAEPHASEGVFNIWHMALENDNYYFNYGIYANGLLVETSSLRMMKEFSGMDLVQ